MNIKNPNTKLLLKYIALGSAVVILSLANPILPLVLSRAYLKKRKFQRSLFLRDLGRLQRRELIDYKEMPNGEIKIILKGNGKRKILQYDIDDMRLIRPRRWDGKWRLIMFDIPDKKRKASNAISLKLRDLGFYKLQKSVYIYPFPCEKEVEFIATVFEVKDCILIMKISSFDGGEKIAHYYNLL